MNPIAYHYVHRGIAHFNANQFDHAIVNFDAALKIDPNEPYARYNRATALLSLGDYARGFPEYEVAWRLFHWRGFGPVGNDIDRITALPLWQGERATRLLVYHELGHGDAIMAMRFLDEISARADATLVIDRALVRTAKSFAVEVTDRVPDDLTGYDCRLPLFAVMGVLGINADNIPAAPYLGSQLPAAVNASDKIGIAWCGRTQTMFTLERFLQLADLDGFDLYSLQPGTIANERVDPLPPGADFEDVANRIEAMDHIVSVDTAAAHLAGAMGHPSAHLLLPYLSDWRWHHVERWYPTLKTYRQSDANDWSAPFARINEALRCISTNEPE
ncbi:tetratricopeptide repeat protein [Bradyrhizobium sp. SRL28]|uniref:tetratricopeptide repeat protein n=1 Tax=Bradyrhizobium sp. SRL28 TaxID=2836178 RepID=UPI001BDF358B|nr:tetratricopeptide repeat protein [Bradyrhizobium sp. SRL28]MBT1509452.1 tetratricopeptide repeat protein [Bradyrhizobium sp. SRL28]